MSNPKSGTIIEGLNASRQTAVNEQTINEANVNDMKTNPTFKKMEAICKKYNYNLNYAYISASTGTVSITATPTAAKSYHPDIFYTDPKSFGGGKGFTIQTTSYGALSLKEYSEFLDACSDAFEIVNALSKIDTKDLYVLK